MKRISNTRYAADATPEARKALNDLSRHQMIMRLEADILMDMDICEIEGWDRMEYVNMLRELLNGFGSQ